MLILKISVSLITVKFALRASEVVPEGTVMLGFAEVMRCVPPPPQALNSLKANFTHEVRFTFHEVEHITKKEL